ncbi:hypothetical protein SH668x_002370 [Planctomicrobium sp. SH668]|uniref:hypothetical protein n=1 Tax=Planctomicrobium sp. SH668 TaxID=3448126 RepID=UPI003F5BE52F
MLDNSQVAILMKVNELAGRYQLEPYQFLATLDVLLESDESELRYCVGPPDLGTPETHRIWDRYEAMLKNLNVEDGGALVGNDEELCRCLHEALQRAPRPRGR